MVPDPQMVWVWLLAWVGSGCLILTIRLTESWHLNIIDSTLNFPSGCAQNTLKDSVLELHLSYWWLYIRMWQNLIGNFLSL